MTTKKKLIEVALPLEAINAASAKEKAIRHGHPATLHLWWARRPLAAARAVIFAQMVDDPSSHPDLFQTEEAQEKERQRLFRIIEELVKWESTTDDRVLEQAREEIRKSWRRTCAENTGHPQAKELFDPGKPPAFHDPFAGGGSLPIEAQRLGLEAYASDLNPVAVLVNKAMIEIPPRFAGRPPVNGEARAKAELATRCWKGAEGLAEDVRYYGMRMRDEAEKVIGDLYPKAEITTKLVSERPDLKQYLGQKLNIIAWLWARTVKSPNPAFAHLDVPLASTYLLSMRKGKEAYLEPHIDSDGYRITVKLGVPKDFETAKNGTKLSRANFVCIMSGAPILASYIREEFMTGRAKAKLLAMVAEGRGERLFLPPTDEMESIAKQAVAEWKPDQEFFKKALGFRIGNYGMSKWSDLFTDRQLVALTTHSDLIGHMSTIALSDARSSGAPQDDRTLDQGGTGALAYSQAISTYLAFGVDKMTDTNTCLCSWQIDPPRLRATFGRQALPMVWDFAEANVFGDAAGDFGRCIQSLAEVLERQNPEIPGHAYQMDAGALKVNCLRVFSTDPPYYDNIGYADLSDFFYVWLRRSLRDSFPSLFATVEVPKAEELVATPARHGGRIQAEAFFLEGMTCAMTQLAQQSHFAFPVTIYYAFKQSENEKASGTASTGWETFLEAVIQAGFTISGTWPMRSELATRNRGREANALASSIVLVCRKRIQGSGAVTVRDFGSALKAELPEAVHHLQKSNIAPVDLAQASIGPGMAVYTRYERVIDAAGKPLSVREALALINESLDEILAEQEGDFDSDSRWALTWFDQMGFAEGDYGSAETLSKAKNTSVEGLERAGILTSSRGRVRLLRPEELPADWDPGQDLRLTAWEIVHQLVCRLEKGGESAAGAIVNKLGSKAEVARELCYRLYTICERKKRAAEALAYNSLVQSWPEINRLAREISKPASEQIQLF